MFIKNAEKLGKDLSCFSFPVLSHSHLGHTLELGPFIRYLTERTIEGLAAKHPKLVGYLEIYISCPGVCVCYGFC